MDKALQPAMEVANIRALDGVPMVQSEEQLDELLLAAAKKSVALYHQHQETIRHIDKVISTAKA